MATKKKIDTPRESPKLDLFKKVLPNIHAKNKYAYREFSDEEKKEFSSGWVPMRWLSSVASADNKVVERYLLNTNRFVNMHFADVDNELKWMLMSVVGEHKSPKHSYIKQPGGKRKKGNPFKEWLREHHPHLSDLELDIWMDSMDKKSAKDMLEQFNVKDKDVISGANDL